MTRGRCATDCGLRIAAPRPCSGRPEGSRRADLGLKDGPVRLPFDSLRSLRVAQGRRQRQRIRGEIPFGSAQGRPWAVMFQAFGLKDESPPPPHCLDPNQIPPFSPAKGCPLSPFPNPPSAPSAFSAVKPVSFLRPPFVPRSEFPFPRW